MLTGSRHARYLLTRRFFESIPALCASLLIACLLVDGVDDHVPVDKSTGTLQYYSEEKVASHILALMAACGQLCNTTVPAKLLFCDPTPENMCLQDLVLPFSQWEPLRKQANCLGLLNSSAILSTRPSHIPAPDRIPPALLDAFSYRGSAHVSYHPQSAPPHFFRLPNIQNSPVWHTPWESIPDLIDECRRGWIRGSYGFMAGRMAFRALSLMSLSGKHLLVFGSERPWLEACALAAGAARVTTIEYSPIKSNWPAIDVITPEEAARRHAQGRLPLFDAVATYSSVEHSGLGRYGDELNPWGDIAMIGQAWCLSKPGALLLLAAPVGGKDVITWNQGREYGPSMFPHLVANWQQVWRSPGGAEVIQIFRSLKREITEGF